MGWLGLVVLLEKNYSPLLMNDFYSGFLVHVDKYENPVKFKHNVLYTFFDGKKHILSETDLGKLVRCENYTSPPEDLDYYLLTICGIFYRDRGM